MSPPVLSIFSLFNLSRPVALHQNLRPHLCTCVLCFYLKRSPRVYCILFAMISLCLKIVLLIGPGLLAALKALQEKICRLELEKSQAEDKLCSLSRAAAQYRKVLEYESYEKDTAHQELMQQRKDESVQLNAAQARCSLLEKQLDYMRKMVSSAEQEKKMILEQQAQLQKEEGQNWLELHAKLEKLEMLEKECLKLTATQRIAESCGIILWHTISSTKFCKITSVKAYLTECHLGFMCISLYSVWTLKVPAVQFYPHITIVSSSRLLIQSFSDLLLALEDELGQMSSEHQELLEQTQESQAREDLQQELDCLVKQMEMKGRQISKLKKHQATVRMKCKLSTNILAERLPELCLLLLSARMSLECFKPRCFSMDDYN
uniref:Centrosomal protein 57kDa-like protein 1 n=1 Tax=Catharus ustulatus TaxID=91951 RepID=A0A8C3U257_CATUS